MSSVTRRRGGQTRLRLTLNKVRSEPSLLQVYQPPDEEEPESPLAQAAQDLPLPSKTFYGQSLLSGVTGQVRRQQNRVSVKLPAVGSVARMQNSRSAPSLPATQKSQSVSTLRRNASTLPALASSGRRGGALEASLGAAAGEQADLQSLQEDFIQVVSSIENIKSSMQRFEPKGLKGGGSSKALSGDRHASDNSPLASKAADDAEHEEDSEEHRLWRMEQYRYVRRIAPPTPPLSKAPLFPEAREAAKKLAQEAAQQEAEVFERNRAMASQWHPRERRVWQAEQQHLQQLRREEAWDRVKSLEAENHAKNMASLQQTYDRIEEHACRRAAAANKSGSKALRPRSMTSAKDAEQVKQQEQWLTMLALGKFMATRVKILAEYREMKAIFYEHLGWLHAEPRPAAKLALATADMLLRQRYVEIHSAKMAGEDDCCIELSSRATAAARQEDMAELASFMKSKWDKLIHLQVLLASKVLLRRRRKAHHVMVNALMGWRVGGIPIVFFLRYAHHMRKIQGWFRCHSQRLKAQLVGVEMEWVRVEKTLLMEEAQPKAPTNPFAEKQPAQFMASTLASERRKIHSTAATAAGFLAGGGGGAAGAAAAAAAGGQHLAKKAKKAALAEPDETVVKGMVSRPVRQHYLEQELRARRRHLQPMLEVWRTDFAEYLKEHQNWMEARRAWNLQRLEGSGAEPGSRRVWDKGWRDTGESWMDETDGFGPPPVPPARPSYLPNEGELLEIIQRARKQQPPRCIVPGRAPRESQAAGQRKKPFPPPATTRKKEEDDLFMVEDQPVEDQPLKEEVATVMKHPVFHSTFLGFDDAVDKGGSLRGVVRDARYCEHLI
eukprot:TRINITY_DN2699_c0_g2_i1.p1 TRINITY_DN2699_c0_g2~~TRINITY_DN2699_c0_g2_i1.p1  ORF type:complete len:837 (+),score=236.60 TRINITY_DN2699_c0_g2_i1:137-2647(+)